MEKKKLHVVLVKYLHGVTKVEMSKYVGPNPIFLGQDSATATSNRFYTLHIHNTYTVLRKDVDFIIV